MSTPTQLASIAALLAVEFNRARLDAITRNESANPVSAVNRYARMQSQAPPIIVSADGTVLDGMHRLAVAHMAGRERIEVLTRV